VGKKVLVYNGKNFKQVKVTREKVGFKFGEFSFTRAFFKAKLKKVLKN
jgi:ribosomal protein S19